MSTFKPLLAATYAPGMERRFPYLASPKLDGIRCVIINGVALSRTLKPIPNKHIQSILGDDRLNGFDGEIIVGSATDPDCFRNTTTIVMSHDKVVEDFTYHVFDSTLSPNLGFGLRFTCLQSYILTLPQELQRAKIVPHSWVEDETAFERMEAEFLDQGYEGLMLRDPNGRYKHGRSTAREQILTKVKRFSDSDCVVLGFEELEHNENEKTVNELGSSKRSSHQEGKVLAGTLGALRVRDIHSGVEFNVGSGLTAIERQDIWDNQQNFVGKCLKYKFFAVGVKEKPRHPVFLNWRSDLDLGEVA